MNEAQLDAITIRVPDVLVSAGAGSGKTTVLTERYFHLLNEKVEGRRMTVDEILTLTFTRKAAQEMRERIARKLEKEGRTFDRRQLSRAPIGTIHSFCESVLREHALQAGIDPNFRLLNDAEARTLRENALDTIFEELWNGSQQEREEIGRLLLEVSQRNLRAALCAIFQTPARADWRSRASHRPPSAPLSRRRARCMTRCEELLALDGTPKWREAKGASGAAYEEILPELQRCGEFRLGYPRSSARGLCRA